MGKLLSGRDGRTVAVSVIFVLILVSAAYALISGDQSGKQLTRALVFVGTVVFGCGEAYHNRSNTRVLTGATLLSISGFAGLYFELNDINGFERPLIVGPLLIGLVLTSYAERLSQ